MNNTTQHKIKILPDFIANQIAAGEVVQRPESALKELVENSLDSGADTIAVVIKESGKQLIHVVDNGSGISKDDLELTCKRHATSKIISAEDLDDIHTFGFRGEALASISSVSNVEIRTKQSGSDGLGWKLTAEPNKEVIIEQCNTETGTQIFVRNLFYNVPARRKFLKANLTEFRYISDTMMKFALSHPETRFTFYDDDTLIFDVHPKSLEERIVDVLGVNTLKSLIKIELENEYIKINGFVGQPHIAKQSRAGQYFFLNKRSITSKSLAYAVYYAYEHLLEKNAHPFFLINLDIDPKIVDVNVHPQKQEVKFEDERMIFKFISNAVTHALQGANLAPSAQFKAMDSASPFEKIGFQPNAKSEDFLIVNKETGEIINTQTAAINQSHSFSHPQNYNRNFQAPPSFAQNKFSVDDTKKSMELIFGKDSPDDVPHTNEIYDKLITSATRTNDTVYWQLHNKYIFVQTSFGFMVIDQHAAHERILYEKAFRAMNREFSYSQNLLFPVNLKLNPSEESILREITNELLSLGFAFQFSNDGAIELTAVPLDVITGEEESALKEILEYYESEQKVKPMNKRDALAASFSCKAAIKTGQSLSFEEMERLIADLFKCETPYACPHGRPVIIEFKLEEFDKRFARI